jgi:hypothetical protein
MDLLLSAPDRLLSSWRLAAYLDEQRKPENVRKRAIDAELARRGIFRRMVLASQAVMTPAFRNAVDARVEERRAAKNENDLASIVESILCDLGVDMEDLHVRLRRATQKEVRKSGAPRRAAQLKIRIRPTVEAARAAIAEVDAQPLGGGPGSYSAEAVADGSDADDISETDADGASA